MTQVKIATLYFSLLSFTPISNSPSDKTKRSAALNTEKKIKKMEDFLITLQVSFVNTETGEIIFTSQFSKPLSVFSSDISNYSKYFVSFFRGVRQRKKVALALTIVNDREIPVPVQQNIVF